MCWFCWCWCLVRAAFSGLFSSSTDSCKRCDRTINRPKIITKTNSHPPHSLSRARSVCVLRYAHHSSRAKMLHLHDFSIEPVYNMRYATMKPQHTSRFFVLNAVFFYSTSSFMMIFSLSLGFWLILFFGSREDQREKRKKTLRTNHQTIFISRWSFPNYRTCILFLFIFPFSALSFSLTAHSLSLSYSLFLFAIEILSFALTHIFFKWCPFLHSFDEMMMW